MDGCGQPPKSIIKSCQFALSWHMFRPKPHPFSFLLLTLLCLTGRSMAQVSCTAVFVNEYRGTGGGPLQPHAVKALPDGTLLVAFHFDAVQHFAGGDVAHFKAEQSVDVDEYQRVGDPKT